MATTKQIVETLTSQGKSIRQIMTITGLGLYGVRYHRRNIIGKKRRYDRIAEHRRKLKRKALDYSGERCMKCKYDRCMTALDFHHLDPRIKKFRISAGKTISWANLKIEVDKTILLCSNCHDEFHDGLWDINEDLITQQLEIRLNYVDRPLSDYPDVEKY